jgi:hypothetical protein
MDETKETVQDRWARLRFAVVGPLLSAPPAAGELGARADAAGREALAPPGERRAGAVRTLHHRALVLRRPCGGQGSGGGAPPPGA